jgi:DNA-binding protein HU-beta
MKPQPSTNRAFYQHHKEESVMTKAELIEQMAKDAGISKTAAGKALDSFVDSVTKSLKKKEKDGKITLVGFGTFSKVRRKARKGRNPATGEEIKIKARNAVKFKPGKALKGAI